MLSAGGRDALTMIGHAVVVGVVQIDGVGAAVLLVGHARHVEFQHAVEIVLALLELQFLLELLLVELHLLLGALVFQLQLGLQHLHFGIGRRRLVLLLADLLLHRLFQLRRQRRQFEHDLGEFLREIGAERLQDAERVGLHVDDIGAFVEHDVDIERADGVDDDRLAVFVDREFVDLEELRQVVVVGDANPAFRGPMLLDDVQ